MRLPTPYTDLSSKQRREVREMYTEMQDGKCFYCDEALAGPPADRIMYTTINLKLFPPNFLEYPVHLQHNHQTDMTEGAVHSYCNAVMWQYEGR